MQLIKDVQNMLDSAPEVNAILGVGPFDDFASLAGALFASLTGNYAIGQTVAETYCADKTLAEMSCYDIEETARRNFEPGGASATVLFSRGIHAVMAHRVAHKIWTDGNPTLALALKATCGRSFDTDIHPAARIGAGVWFDHGLGCVIGETSVIEEDVSIWHNVTLGSTLNDDGPRRHPHVGRGAVIGAGAILLGGILIGKGSNIAAGAIVVEDVADNSLVVGCKAQLRGKARVSFTPSEAKS